MDDRIVNNTTRATTLVATMTTPPTTRSDGTTAPQYFLQHHHPTALVVFCVSLLLTMLVGLVYYTRRRKYYEQREQARRRNEYVELLHNTHGYRIYNSPGAGGAGHNYWEQPEDEQISSYNHNHNENNRPFAVGGSMNVVILWRGDTLANVPVKPVEGRRNKGNTDKIVTWNRMIVFQTRRKKQ